MQRHEPLSQRAAAEPLPDLAQRDKDEKLPPNCIFFPASSRGAVDSFFLGILFILLVIYLGVDIMNSFWSTVLPPLFFIAYIPIFLSPYGPNSQNLSEVPIWHWAILVGGFVFWLWMMQDAFVEGKFLWLIGIFFLFVLGAVAYWYLDKGKRVSTSTKS